MVAAHASSLFHKLLVRLDLFCSFLSRFFTPRRRRRRRRPPFETALRAKVLDLPHPLPPPDSPSKPSHSPSWLRLPNKFPGNFFSSTPAPLSAACPPFLFFLSLTCLFFPFGALRVSRSCRPLFFSLSHSGGQGTDHQ